ncbi:MAG: hypothetical protein OXU86_05070 [Thaumarchaeota archaeon]|nr:hypothetical protein [Nitrososphaerota archaeon]MDD9826123.1 hypothetical protein [Nitrososphaerota archaeon]
MRGEGLQAELGDSGHAGAREGFEESLLRDHPCNERRGLLLASVRSRLGGAAPGAARDEALRALDALRPHSPLSSWVRLRDRLAGVEASLASAIGAECQLVHLSVLSSARSGDDLVPVAHAVCMRFMEAWVSCVASWEAALRDISARLDPGAAPQEDFCLYAAGFLRFGSASGAGLFAPMVRELCAARGHRGAACGACEAALAFRIEDAQAALAPTAIEDAVACVADSVVASGLGDPPAVERCADILEERSRRLGLGRRRVAREPGAVAAAAREMSASRLPEGSSWRSIPVVYPLECDFEGQMDAIRRPLSERMGWQEAMDLLELSVTLLLGALSRNVAALHGELASAMLYAGRGTGFGPRMRDYIVDSARFGSGADDAVPLCLLRCLYSERGLYSEALDVCEGLVGLGGADAQRMAASPLIENAVGDILAGARRAGGGVAESIAARCLRLLRRRSESLGLGLERRKYAGSALRQAAELAQDIAARRRMYGQERLERHIRRRYPLSHGFLNVGEDIAHMVENYSDIAFHVSTQVHIQELADTSRKRYCPDGALEELEETLGFLRSKSVPIDRISRDWRNGMKSLQLWDMLFEMGVYAHLVAHVGNVALHPKISGGKRADFEVANHYIEAYSPLDTLVAAPGNVIVDPRAESKVCCNVMGKPQIDHFGQRRSILAVECQALDFGSETFRGLLRRRLRRRPQLGGLLLASRHRSCYYTAFLENEGASIPLDGPTVRRICGALETPLASAPPRDQI